jgi:putative flippase GtrA
MKGKLTRFVIVGGGSTALYFALMWFFRAALQLTPFLATIAAYATSFCVAYTLQHRWTFRSDAAHRVTLPRYALAQTACALLTAGITEATARLYPHSPNWLLAGISTVLASSLSFVLSSMWVFSSPSR